MAGSGWNASTAGPGVTLSTDGLKASRPDAGGGGLYAGIRGAAGRKKGQRYFEIDATSTACSVGVVDENADLGSALGSGANPSQWGFWLQYGYLYYRDTSGNGNEDKGTGAVPVSIMGILVDFDAHTMTVYTDGVELFTHALSFAADTVLYPAVSMGTSTVDVELVTKEPFSYPPPSNHIAWDIFDGAILSSISGNMKIDGAPVARQIKAFSYERLVFEIDNTTTQESKPLGQTISDAATGDYEITLRGGYPREVFVVAFDDYGDAFVADAAVTVGDRIHPTTPNGYTYECTGNGMLPSAEPNPWPTDTEASHAIGTASFEVKPFYRPEAHGPVLPAATTRTVIGIGEAISAGSGFTLAIRDDGTVAAWGKNHYGQCNVPAGAVDVIQVAAGNAYGLALKADGSVVGWGYNDKGQASPPVLTDAVFISAGYDHALAMLADGTVVAWGNNYNNAATVPAGLSAVAISAAYRASFAIKADGSLQHWGSTIYGMNSVPAGNKFALLSTSLYTGFAIDSMGSVSTWGDSSNGIRTIPAGLVEPSQISESSRAQHALGLNAGGELFAWGNNADGQTTIPTDLPPVVAIAAGESHSAVVTTSGEVICWGRDESGQLNPPAGLIVKLP